MLLGTRFLIALGLASTVSCARPTEAPVVAAPAPRPGSPEDLTIISMQQPATIALAVVRDAGAPVPVGIDAPLAPLPPLTDAGIPTDASRQAR